jgi:hypothetical protein
VGDHQTLGRCVAIAVVLLGVTRPASGQTPATPTVGFGEFFRTLYAPAIRDVASNGGPTLETDQWGAASVLNGLLVAEAVTLPTSSNAGGFAWTYDSTLGTWSRAVDSFGSQFIERSQTAGRHKGNFGFAVHRFTFDHLNGQPLAEAGVDASAVLNDHLPPDQRLRVGERVSLSRADLTLATLYVNYGITSTFDLGVFVPTTSIEVDGLVQYTLQRNTPRLDLTRTTTASAQSNLVGPPVFRAKWNFFRRPTGGMALAGDFRPHSATALGAGGTRLAAIGTLTKKAVNAHVNGGVSGLDCDAAARDVEACDALFDPFVAGGVDRAISRRVTLSADVLAHRSTIQLANVATTLPANVFQSGSNQAIRSSRVTAALTGRINLWGNLLVTVAAMFTTSSNGLSDRFTPVVGLDYAW